MTWGAGRLCHTFASEKSLPCFWSNNQQFTKRKGSSAIRSPLGWFLESKTRSASAVPDRNLHQSGEEMKLQAPRFCEGNIIPASANRTISWYHFHLNAAAAWRRARVLPPQHPRGSLPAATGTLAPPLRAGSSATVFAGRGRSPRPSPPPRRGRGEGCPRSRGRQEPPPRGAEGTNEPWLRCARIHPERWPWCYPEPQPSSLPSLPPSLLLSLPRPHLSSKTAGAVATPLQSLRYQPGTGASGPRRRHGPGREQPRRLPAAPLPWPGSRPSVDDVAGHPAGGRLGSRPGGWEAAGGPGRTPGAPGAAGEAAGAGAGRPSHAAAPGGGRSRAAPVRPQQGAPAGSHPHRPEGAAGKGRDDPLPPVPIPRLRGSCGAAVLRAGAQRGALPGRLAPGGLTPGSPSEAAGAVWGRRAGRALQPRLSASPTASPAALRSAGRCERRGPVTVVGASCGGRARPCRCRYNGRFFSSGGVHLSAYSSPRHA